VISCTIVALRDRAQSGIRAVELAGHTDYGKQSEFNGLVEEAQDLVKQSGFSRSWLTRPHDPVKASGILAGWVEAENDMVKAVGILAVWLKRQHDSSGKAVGIYFCRM